VIFANFRHPRPSVWSMRLSAASGPGASVPLDNGSTAVEVALQDRLAVVAEQGSPRRQLIAF